MQYIPLSRLSLSAHCHITGDVFRSVSTSVLGVVKFNKLYGAGSGYLTAIFALLVGETGCAVGVEHIPELTERAIENVKKSKAAHLLASGSLSLHTGGQSGDYFVIFHNAITVTFRFHSLIVYKFE